MIAVDKRPLLVELARGVWAFRGRVAAAVALLLLAKLAAVVVPLALKRIVDAMSRPEALEALPVALLGGYAAVRFSATLFGELRDLVFARAAQTVVAGYLRRTFAHLHALGAKFHADRATGALARDIERGTAAIAFLIGVAFFTIVPTLVEIGAVLTIMIASYGTSFSLLIAGTFVLYAVFTAVFIARRAAQQRRVTELDSSAHRRLVDSLLNYETVKFYTNEGFESRQFGGIMDDWIEAGVANQTALTQLHVGQSAIIALGVAAVMLLAGARVLDGTLTVGDLVLVNAYVIQVCLPLNSLGFVLREANDALIKAERLFGLLGQRPDPEPPASAAPRAHIVEVRFENVTFGYEPSRLVLQNVDFAIPPGKTVAVVGGSGSGKSTIGRLLLRFYDPSSGRIFVDGSEVRELPRAAVRAAIGVVPQDTTLFNDTIAYNIAYGRIGASHDEVVAAAKAANVHDFVAALPAGYDTLVGERGLKLSGGEKQRIAIARAILKDAPILILDEATSALDSRAERAIQGALERLAAPRTTLIVAHRLATIVDADEILVLDRGRIVERGRHAELLDRGGLYAQMWALQQAERELRRSERRAVLQPVNPSALVANAIDAARAEIESKGIHLFTTLGLDVGLVTGDPGALHRVVFALLAHAVEVSEPGARVELDLERAGNEVRLRVTDTSGMGTGEASRPREPGRGPERRFDAAMVRGILEEHHGRFAVEQAGPATTYVAALPVRAVAPPAAASSPPAEGAAPAPAAPPSFEGRSLLIVDDDEDARESLRLLLELHHAQVLSFASGQAALDYLKPRARTSWPDLMICDIGLPDEDGYRVLRRVRGVEAERHVALGERMPAIALTGYAQAEDRMRALVAGFQAHLAKPALPQELLATIGRLLGAPA